MVANRFVCSIKLDIPIPGPDSLEWIEASTGVDFSLEYGDAKRR